MKKSILSVLLALLTTFSVFAAGIDTPLLKTQWGPRIDKLQFAPNKEGVRCDCVTIAQILYYHNLDLQGSDSYATSKGIYWRDFDANKTNFSKLPLTYNDRTATDAQMKDYDNFLYNCGILLQHHWDKSDVYFIGFPRDITAHAPASVEVFYYEFEGHKNITKQEFQDKIVESLNKKLPVHYGIWSKDKSRSHSVVIDAAKTDGNNFQVHLNFGWNGVCDGWYNLWEPILVKDNTVAGGYRRYDSDSRDIVIVKPLSSSEKAKWKPFKLTDEQVQNIKKETRKVCEISNGTLYIPEGTTYLVNNFKNNKQIKKIEFPSTFRGFISSKFDFVGCENLESIIYKGVTSDTPSTNSFDGCTKLKSATFTSSCKDISDGIFWKITNLKEVTLADGLENIKYGAFYNTSISTLKLPETVKEIGDYAFYKTALTEVYIPLTVKKIGTSAFSKTVKIICDKGSVAEAWAKSNGNSYQIKGSTPVEDYAISNGKLTIREGLSSIPKEKFMGNKEIREIVFPTTITKLGTDSFKDCTNLENIIYNGVRCSGPSTNTFDGCTKLKSATFTSSCRAISDGIFWKITSLKEVTLAEGIEDIRYGAFYNTSISNVKIPSTVKEIGDYAFYKTALTEIYIPSTVTKIGTSAFSKTVKIICDKGSAAEAWAKKNGNKCEIKN